MNYSLRSLMILVLVLPPLLAAAYFLVRSVQSAYLPHDPFAVAGVTTCVLMGVTAWEFYRKRDPGYLTLLLMEFLAFLFFFGVLFLQ